MDWYLCMPPWDRGIKYVYMLFFAKAFTVPELVASLITGNHLLHLDLKFVVFKISEVLDCSKNHVALSLNAWPMKHKEMFVPVFKNTHCQADTASFP